MNKFSKSEEFGQLSPKTSHPQYNDLQVVLERGVLGLSCPPLKIQKVKFFIIGFGKQMLR